MAMVDESWEEMFQALAAFARKNGHCCVRTNSPHEIRLGRWVATQRHRRKLGRLSEEQIRRLDSIGFAWSPCDEAWENMFRALVKFREKYGDCDVPSHWAENPTLSNWVANQRHRRKLGRLSGDRIRKLDSLGFTWAIYRAPKDGRVLVRRRRRARAPVRPARKKQVVEERLYHVEPGLYVQHNGKGPKPRELIRYEQSHGGDLPPYIPLPTQRTIFYLGDAFARKPRTVTWRGHGRLPKEVIEYVNENGVLPVHR